MIFINGLQRSGTNFAHQIYQGSTQYSHPYWKHDYKLEGIDPEHPDVICIIKNPYTWIESICFRNPVDIVEWFPARHLKDSEDYLGPFQINLRRLLDTYHIFYTSWMNYDKTKLVHYEDLLVKHQIDKVPMSNNWDANRKKQYLKYEAPLLPESTKKFIKEYWPQEFFDRIGYEMK